jgi:hypothetical protein
MTLTDSQEESFRLRAAVEAQVSPPPPVDAHSLDVLAVGGCRAPAFSHPTLR